MELFIPFPEHEIVIAEVETDIRTVRQVAVSDVINMPVEVLLAGRKLAFIEDKFHIGVAVAPG